MVCNPAVVRQVEQLIAGVDPPEEAIGLVPLTLVTNTPEHEVVTLLARLRQSGAGPLNADSVIGVLELRTTDPPLITPIPACTDPT